MIKPNTKYMEKYLSNLKGQSANREAMHLAMQPALGGLGEAVAQQVSGEGFKLGEVALETIAELPGGTAEIGIGLALEGRRERKEAELEKLKE